MRQFGRWVCVAALSWRFLGTGLSQEQEPAYFQSSTVKHFQLTGDEDRPRRMATSQLTGTRAGLLATDLGSSFEHQGKLYFLFGDSIGRPGARDALAWTEAATPGAVHLEFHTDATGRFQPLTVPGISLADFEVPSYGISVNGSMYVVFTTDHSLERVMGRSVLAVSEDDGLTFRALHDLSITHFINVAMALASRAEHPDLPVEDAVLIWGSGEYRASSPRLAYVPAASIGDPAAIRYFSGLAEEGESLWSSDESQATPLFVHDVIGEFSVTWCALLERWLLLYNSEGPRGIVLRTARNPWGPWSSPRVIFEPWNDMGYSQFLHVSWGFKKLDIFHDAGRENTWGGEYGPYIIDRFTEGTSDRVTIYYTLSSWNPYQVVLMSSDIGYPGRAPPAITCSDKTLPVDGGWTTFGRQSGVFLRNGIRHQTTFGPGGDADMSVSHLPVPVSEEDIDGWIEFTIHGGHGEVVLVREEGSSPPANITDIPAFHSALKGGTYGPVVEAITGPESNADDVATRWSLRRHRGHSLRLYVVDSFTDGWGFVSYSEFNLRPRIPRPEIACPGNVTVPCSGIEGAAVAFEVTVVDNCSGAPRIDSIPASGSLFPVGTTTVQSTAVYPDGQRLTCSFTVTVSCDLGGQVPGDTNQDGKVDISDGVRLLGFLFLGDPTRLPCGDGNPANSGNAALLDWNGDGRIDLSDAVAELSWLFTSGPGHAGGAACQGIPECPRVCGG